MANAELADLDNRLDAVPGVVSVWYGPVGGPARFSRAADRTHYAASIMKPAVLAALYRRAEAGLLDVDHDIDVLNDFHSALPGAPRFSCRREYDDDAEVWRHLGATRTLRWLAARMIVGSSNLATNIVLSHITMADVAAVWRLVGAEHSAVGRGIEDSAAADAGITNVVTAADVAALLSAIDLGCRSPGPLASPTSCEAMRDILMAQEHSEDLAAGLPANTTLAHKNGWVRGVRHSAGIVYPADAPPFVLAVCTTTPLAVNEAGDAACQLVASIAATAWADWHSTHRSAR